MSSANVVVLSPSLKIKLALQEKLRAERSFTVDINSVTLADAQNRFLKNTVNILVLDTDSHSTEVKFLKMIMEKHLLFIVTMGKRCVISDSAISFIQKPLIEKADSAQAVAGLLYQKIKTLSSKVPIMTARDMGAYVDPKQKIIAVASSTGGTDALPVVLKGMPSDCPPIIIVQHMPSMFTKQLADRIDKMCAISVKEAQNGEFIKRGTAYIAPGDLHMKMVIRQQRLTLDCFYGERMHGVRPAADILFDSVAAISGANAIGVILTGMGSDGARGLMEMHKKGAKVVGQDKASSIVYGMPKAAFDLGAVDVQAPLDQVAARIIKFYQG